MYLLSSFDCALSRTRVTFCFAVKFSITNFDFVLLQLDVVLESNLSTIRVLEAIQKKLQRYTSIVVSLLVILDSCSCLKYKNEMGHFFIIYLPGQ